MNLIIILLRMLALSHSCRTILILLCCSVDLVCPIIKLKQLPCLLVFFIVRQDWNIQDCAFLGKAIYQLSATPSSSTTYPTPRLPRRLHDYIIVAVLTLSSPTDQLNHPSHNVDPAFAHALAHDRQNARTLRSRHLRRQKLGRPRPNGKLQKRE